MARGLASAGAKVGILGRREALAEAAAEVAAEAEAVVEASEAPAEEEQKPEA